MIRFGKNPISTAQPFSFPARTYAKPRNIVNPTITGATTTVGSVMTADPGQWSSGGTLTMHWYLNGQLVQDGGVSYTVKTGDPGKTLTLSVGAMNAYGGASAISAGRLL